MSDSAPEVWQEPVRGHYTHPGLFAALPGYDLLKTYQTGQTLPPPLHYLFGLTISSVERESVTFTMPSSRWLLPPQGVISGATLALLVDGPLGCTVQTALPAATPYTTAEMSLSFLKPVTADSGLLTGTGRLVHAGRSLLVSEVAVTDGAANLVAIATTRCVVLPRMEFPPGFAEAALADPPRHVEPEYATPNPVDRPVLGEVIPQEAWDRLSGLEILQRQVEGTLPLPPLSRLTGLSPVAVEKGTSTFRLPATEWLCSPIQGRLYGGATAMLAGTAIDTAIESTCKAGTAFAPVDLKVYFLRPVAPDGRDLVATGQVVHRGRSLAVGTSEVRNADGKLVALATSSAMILPGRPAAVARAVETGIPAPADE